MAKEKPQTPDSPYDETLEKRVDEMMDTGRDVPAKPKQGRSIPIVSHDDAAPADVPGPSDETPPADEITSTAPVLADAPVPKEPLKVNIVHFDDQDTAAQADQKNATDDDATQASAAKPTPAKKKIVPIVAPEPDEDHEGVASAAADDTDEPETAPLYVPGLPIASPDEAPSKTPEKQPSDTLVITDTTAPAVPEVASTTTTVNQPDNPPLAEPFTDVQTSKIVDTIIAEESDALLGLEQPVPRPRTITPPKARQQRRRFGAVLKDVLRNWWRYPVTRWLSIAGILAALAAAGGIPTSRYAILNGAGVRSSATVQILDQSTQQPLKNVTVKLADQSGQTDERGVVRLSRLRLGPTMLSLEKRAFTPITQSVTIGWGSNPLGDFRLTPSGSQYTFIVKDYVSGNPVATAMATSAYADANADDKGDIRLTLDQSSEEVVDVTISAPGYRDEVMQLDTKAKQEQAVSLVTARKHAFVSNRSGKYDLYKIDIDGKNEKVVLAGTGSERADLVLAQNAGQNVAALVSTRDNVRNADGYLLSTLTIVNLESGAVTKVAQSEQIHVIGWSGDYLAYVQIASGASAGNPDRERLMSYNYSKKDNKQLASANYFNDVLTAAGKLYYAPSGGVGEAASNFIRMNYDGSGKQVLLVGETWNAFRTDYTHIAVSVPGQWYEHIIGSNATTKMEGQPANPASRVYVDAPEGKQSLWVDTRDGKGVLLKYDMSQQKDTEVVARSGLRYPVRWLDAETVVYRIETQQETADYVVSLNGGEPNKIKDVTATGNNDRWYYY